MIRRWSPFLLIAIAVLAATRPFWWQPAPYYVIDDGLGHLFRIFEFDRVIREGVFYPRWAPDLAFGYGYPVFNFYAPLTDYLAGSLHIFGLTLPDAIKAVMALTVLMAALGAFVLGDELFREHREHRLIGATTAVAYILFPYFILDFYTRGAIAEALAGALLPWLVWAWRRVLETESLGSALVAALFSAALVLTHNLTALVAAPILGIYLFWQWIRLPSSNRIRVLLASGSAVLLGSLVSAIYWLPLVAELSLVGMSRSDMQLWTMVTENFLSVRDLIQLSWLYEYGGAPFPLALTPVLLGLLGALVVIFFARGQRARGTILFFCAVALVSMILLLDWTKGLWLTLPLLRSIQFPWRLSILIDLGIALAVGGLASVVLSQGLSSLRARSPRAAAWIALGFAALSTSLFVWTAVSNLAPRRINSLHGDVELAPLVRQEMVSQSIGFGSMYEYIPLTVKALPDRLNPAIRNANEPEIHLEEYNATKRVFTVSTSEPVSISLHSFYFPDWPVTRDDQVVAAYPSTLLGLLTVDVPPGSHRFVVELVDTLPRQAGVLLTGMGALALLSLAAWVVYRREKETPTILACFAITALILMPVAITAWQSHPPVLQPATISMSPELNMIGVQVEDAQWVGQVWRVSRPPAFLHLVTYWQVKRSLEDRLTAWRLVDQNGRVWAKQERFSRYAAGQPRTWVPNEIVPDRFDLALEPDMPRGRYLIQAAYGNREYSTVTGIELEQGSAPAPAEPAIEKRISSRLGDSIQFVGYTLAAPLRPGQMSPMMLYWETETSLPVDYTAFVQLIDYQGNLVAQHDGLTADGYQTTSLWVPGTVVQDWHDLYVPKDIKPGLYRVVAGLYLLRDLKRLPVIDETGASSPDDVVELGEVKIPMDVQGVRPRNPLDIALGPAIRLLGYEADAADAKGKSVAQGDSQNPSHMTMATGQSLELKLYWQASSPLNADYKVFVHILDESGNVVAQQDRFPGEKYYPTRIWQAGEKIEDVYRVLLKNVPAGRYRVFIGMYNPDSGERLPAVDAKGNALPDRNIPVGIIEVRNP